MDISSMLVGKSDQLDNVDLLSGPRDFTITGVARRDGDQPLDITLAEYDRPWRPGLTMRRLLAAMWGKDASVYVGRTVRLYRDPDVRFGSDKTGGTRISHASHLDKRVTVTLPTSKGKFGAFTVEPLPDVQAPAILAGNPEPTAADVDACTDVDMLREMYRTSGPERRAQIQARVASLGGDR
ncbi:MAG: hypothetical protein M0Z51_16900 [Propionibacterium sp.]|nr:hypothetical protein [Propionibacterium sp.]